MSAEADAVLASLSGQIRCDCGLLHSVGSAKSIKARWGGYMKNRTFAECECGIRHAELVCCQCGTTWEYGPKKGWKMISRKLGRWVAIEKELRGQIAEIQEMLTAVLEDRRSRHGMQPFDDGEYVHMLHCNASRDEPVGCYGCSCPIGRRFKGQHQAEAAFDALSGKVFALKHSDGPIWIDDGRRAAWWSRSKGEWKQEATFLTGSGKPGLKVVDIPEWFTGNAPR